MKTPLPEFEGWQLTLSDVPDAAARRTIHEGIKAFNDALSPHHRAVRHTGSRPLDIIVSDRDGHVRGGLTAETYWDWLEVDDLWLAEELRGRGLGTVLLQAAEAEAVRRDCRRAFLRTFSFQARGFYEKHGYQVVGRLEDYPPGAVLYTLRKELPPVSGRPARPEL